MTLNNILPRLAGVKYLTLIDANSYYHNIKFDEQSSYLTTSSCPFGRYGYIRLLFRGASTGDMFQRRIDKLFHRVPNVFGIADDILIVGFDDFGKDHDETVSKVLEIWRKANVKLNKDEYLQQH